VTTTTTAGTTISAMTTTTMTTTTNTTLAVSSSETTASEYTIPSMPEITITTSTALSTTTESAASQSASATTAAETTAQTAVTVGKSFTLEAETITAAPGAKNVPFKVQIHNNPGFSSATFVVKYGSLLPVGEKNTKNEAKFDGNEKLEGALHTCMFNNETQLMAYALLSQNDFKENGTLCTFYFDLPADAKSGSEYPISLSVSSIANNAGKTLQPETIEGKIIVK
jgi:hypothetical protein